MWMATLEVSKQMVSYHQIFTYNTIFVAEWRVFQLFYCGFERMREDGKLFLLPYIALSGIGACAW